VTRRNERSSIGEEVDRQAQSDSARTVTRNILGNECGKITRGFTIRTMNEEVS
jgi:hypothetical protein